MGLACTEVLFTVPLASYFVYANIKSGVVRWRGWSDTHFDFSRVEQIPSLVWKSSPSAVLACELTRWSIIMCAFVFFAFFGFTEEARNNYRTAFNAIAERIGYTSNLGGARHKVPYVMEFTRRSSPVCSSKDYGGTGLLHSVIVIEPLHRHPDISISFTLPPLALPEPILDLALIHRHFIDEPGPARGDVMPTIERESEK